jgi:PKD repeat protein
VGGAYRWDESSGSWIQLFDWLDPANGSWNGIGGFSITEAASSVIWVVAGFPGSSEVLKSTDRGDTWTPTGFPDTDAFNGNQRDVRYIGERIAVDPLNENYVYVGTIGTGLYKTTDAGDSWINLSDIPGGTISSRFGANVVGIRSLAFDKSQTTGSGSTFRTKVIYAGAYEDGIYKSVDGGNTFTKMVGSPETPRRMKVANDGSLWVTTGYPIGGSVAGTGGGRLYHFTGGQWIDKSPVTYDGEGNEEVRRPYGAFDLFPSDDNRMIVAVGTNRGGQPIYRTTNAMSSSPTWTKINPEYDGANKIQPDWWPGYYHATGPSAFQFNPADQNEIWMTDGYGTWRVPNVWAGSSSEEAKTQINWYAEVVGHEEIIPHTLASGPSGANLFVGGPDVDGFRYTDVNSRPTAKFQPSHFGTTGIAMQENNPNNMLRYTVDKFGGEGTPWLYKSSDNGVTWTNLGNFPHGGTTSGKVAISSTDPNTMLVLPHANNWMHSAPIAPVYSLDGGQTWSTEGMQYFNPRIVDNWWMYDHMLEADKVQGGVFYLFHKRKGEFYRVSLNGGVSFDLMHTFENHEQDWGSGSGSYWKEWVHLRTRPGVAGEVWLSLPKEGLFKTSDGGSNWTKINGIANPEGVAFGKGTGSTASSVSVYVLAKLHDELALMVSDDEGETWGRCDDEDFNFSSGVSSIEGDRQVYGRVYLGLGDRGVFQFNRNGTPPAVDLPLIAAFTADPTSGPKPLPVNFDASGSEDSDGGILSYAWDFGDGTTGSGVAPSHTYSENGLYTVILTVSSSNETSTAAKIIDVNSTPLISWASPEDNSSYPTGTM